MKSDVWMLYAPNYLQWWPIICLKRIKQQVILVFSFLVVVLKMSGDRPGWWKKCQRSSSLMSVKRESSLTGLHSLTNTPTLSLESSLPGRMTRSSTWDPTWLSDVNANNNTSRKTKHSESSKTGTTPVSKGNSSGVVNGHRRTLSYSDTNGLQSKKLSVPSEGKDRRRRANSASSDSGIPVVRVSNTAKKSGTKV